MNLVLVHAFPLSTQMWVPLSRHLSTTTEVISAVLPGFGGQAVSSAEPSLGVMAQAVLEQVNGEFVVGGCSMGGYIAMELIRRAPQRIAGVILMDTKAEPDAEAAIARRHEVAAGVESDGIAAWLDTLQAPLLGASTRANNSALVEEVRSAVSAADPSGVAWAQRAMAARPDSRGTLVNFRKPALVIVGEQDELAPVAVARDLAELLPEGELAVIPEAGHLAPWEQPDRTAEVVARWWTTSFPHAG